jgi:hypothetical protein
MSIMREFRVLFIIAGLALLCTGRWSSATPGDLYVSQGAEGTILKFAPDGTKSTFSSGLDQPRGLAFDQTGNLSVSAGSDQFGDIVKIAPSGEVTVFASGLSFPGPLGFDGAGNLYVGEITGDVGPVSKITPDGMKSTFGSDTGTEIGWPLSLAFSPVGNLFVSMGGPTNLDGGIVWYEPNGTGHTFAFSGGGGLAFDTAGNLYEANGDEILKFTPLPEAEQSVFISGLKSAGSLAFDSAGNLFVAEFATPSSGSISKVTPAGNKTLFASGLDQVASIAFEPITEKLRNISARGLVGTGDGALIGGFIVGGNALANNAVVLRAIGPSLAQAGVTNPLADPTLELHNASGATIASNDDWQDTQEAEIMASGLPPTDPNESAIFATLPAGNFTAVVRGADDTTGVALVEVYSVAQ